MKSHLWLLLLCWAAAPLFAAEAGAAGALDRDLRAVDPSGHIRALSSHPSRYTGYPGCDEAGKYIARQFRELGLANVSESPFQVVVPIAPIGPVMLLVARLSSPVAEARSRSVATATSAEDPARSSA